LGGNCIVLDAGVTLPVLFEGSGNAGCNNIPYTAPTITSACTTQYNTASYGLDRITGSFNVLGTCAIGSTFTISTANTNQFQHVGWSCSFSTPDVRENGTLSGNQFGIYAINAVTNEYIQYNCFGF
jgi:hypothetical protein